MRILLSELEKIITKILKSDRDRDRQRKKSGDEESFPAICKKWIK